MRRAKKADEQTPGEVITGINFVRVETLLRKYPMHVLQKGSKATELVISDVDAEGQEVIKWCVKFKAEEGAPGELAYRIDRLIIDKCLEAHREIPNVLRLGTLGDICKVLDIPPSGKNMRNIKSALLQLQGTRIDIANDLGEGRFYRYPSIMFTGDKRSDGTRSDAIYLEISTAYQAILRRSSRRPLDYDYIGTLPPAASRLYELVSSRIFAALQKGGRNLEARILYSEFCELSALTRYEIYKSMAFQMKRIHKPHIESSYISGVTYDARTDKRGRPDWMMIYTPGDKARREFRAATKRGVEVKPPAQVIDITEARSEPIQAPLPLPATKPLTDAQALAQRLVKAGVWITKAQALVELYPEAAEIWAEVYESGALSKKNDPGAYLAKAISENAQPPKRYRDQKKALERGTQEEARRKTKRDWEREEIAAMREYIDGLSIEEAEQFEHSVIESLSATEQKILESLNAGKARSQVLEDFRLKYWRAMIGGK
jgi:hypothetical protein